MRQVLRKMISGKERGFGVLTLGCALAIAGCGGGGGGGGGGSSISPSTSQIGSGTLPGTSANLVAIDLFPKGDISIFGSQAATAAAPPQQQVIVAGYYKDGATRDLSRQVSYVVADPAVARVSGDGLVTPTGAGTTTLTVTEKGINGQTLTITRNIVVDFSKIAGAAGSVATSLELYPGPVTRLTDVNPAAAKDQFQQFVVLVRYQDGTCEDLTRNFGLVIQDDQGNPTTAARFTTAGLLRATGDATIDVVANASAMSMVASVRVISGTGGANGGNGNGFTPYTGVPLAGSTNIFDVVALAALKSQLINPAPLSTDGEFLRRVTADTVGRLPTDAELTAFAANTAPTKRATTIDALLASPEFAAHWAKDVLGAWCGITGANRAAFDAELQTQLAADAPLSAVVGAMAAGTGPLGTGFNAQFPSAYMKVDQLLNTFTGYTSKCARCHDHPLTTIQDDPRWSQDQNYGLYAFFAANNGEATKVDKTGRMFGTPVQPAFVFDPTATGLGTLADPMAARRQKFADLFVVSKAFAKGTGHRIWAEIMGPMLDPDQFLQVNLAGVKNPKLLDTVTQAFSDQKTSLKGFLRQLLNSKLYQLSGTGKDTKNDELYSRHVARRHHAEVVDAGTSALAGVPFTALNTFVSFNFGYPTTRSNIHERSDAVNMSQAFTQMNSNQSTNARIAMTGNQIDRLATSVTNNSITMDAAITTLFRAALSRDPSAAELATFVNESKTAATPREFLQDAAVALGASIEFVIR